MSQNPVNPSDRRRWLGTGIKAGAVLTLAPLLSAPLRAQSRVLRIGFQKGGLLYLVRSQGRIEEALAPLSWSVSWHEFPAGPQLLEALNAGSIDFGYTGAPPPIFAQAAGKDIVYVGAETSGESVEAIIVKPDSPLREVSDLKARRVAVQKGSSANYLLLAALRHHGLSFSDIEPVYLPPADGRAAFESGRVDAWVVWDPYLAAVQAAIGARVIADYKGLLRPYSFYESSRVFVSKQPEVVSRTLDAVAAVGAWASANPAKVAEELAPQLGLPVPVVETWQRRTKYGALPVSDDLIAIQQTVADTFHQNRLIPKAVTIRDAVWTWQRL